MSTTTILDGTTNKIQTKDYSKAPYKASVYGDMRGVVDFGNLLQFAPYLGGYCFLAVLNGPYFIKEIADKSVSDAKAKMLASGKVVTTDGIVVSTDQTAILDLQEAFIEIIEKEFKGLSGIDNISTENIEWTDGLSTLSLISKTNVQSNGSFSMSFTEKAGSLITKYISTYLRLLKDGRTQAKTYGGFITSENADSLPAFYKEVFNLLYVVTDDTCLNIEKAFLILNAQPTEAAYSDLYNASKGQIEVKEIDVTFNGFVAEGSLANKLAKLYMNRMILTNANTNGTINLNSYDYNWSISGIDGKVVTDPANKLHIKNKDKLGTEGSLIKLSDSDVADYSKISAVSE